MLRRAGIMTLVAGLAFAVGAGVSYASHVDPEVKSGNPRCADFNSNYKEIRDIPPKNGTYKSEDGKLEVTIKNFSEDGTTFDWESNIGVDAVFVKGGNQGGNLYTYDPPNEETSDTGLHPPTNENPNNPLVLRANQDEKYAAVSHIDVCYDEEEGESPAPSESPGGGGGEESPGPSESPGGGGGGEESPGPSYAPGESPAPSESPAIPGGGGGSETGTGSLTKTGANSGRMAATAMVLVALGLVMQEEARRRSAKS